MAKTLVDGRKWLDLYARMLKTMEAAFRDCEIRVPAPVPEQHGTIQVFRYQDKSIHQALVMKLSFIISTLRSAYLLHLNGYSLQQGALQRMADEAGEDVAFLAYAVAENDVTDLHREFLDYFWAEEFSDFENPMQSHASRGMVKRRKIHAYLNKRSGADPSAGQAAMTAVTKGYSGYVHAAAPHLMDAYVGKPPHFLVQGVRGTPVHLTMLFDLWNYMFRGFQAHIFAAMAFGDQDQIQKLLKQMAAFERDADKGYSDSL